jgi:3'-phosphoadenosine 5'-phosphosulfate (PAPS) 3'-phosphatase
VLSEEREDDLARLEKEHFWCVDPLDGTLPYIENRPGYAVSIALVSRSGSPLIGVVVDPANGTLYRAIRGHGLSRDGEKWKAPDSSDVLSVYADRSFESTPHFARIKASLENLTLEMGLTSLQIHTGSAAVINACQTLAHPPACYFKFPKSAPGGGSLWDFAATACIFHEAGAVATDISGRDLDLNRADSTFMNHRGVLFASDRKLATSIKKLYAEVAR